MDECRVEFGTACAWRRQRLAAGGGEPADGVEQATIVDRVDRRQLVPVGRNQVVCLRWSGESDALGESAARDAVLDEVGNVLIESTEEQLEAA